MSWLFKKKTPKPTDTASTRTKPIDNSGSTTRKSTPSYTPPVSTSFPAVKSNELKIEDINCTFPKDNGKANNKINAGSRRNDFIYLISMSDSCFSI